MGDEGAEEEVIIDFKKFEANAEHSGSIYAGDFDKQFVLCFDNKYSYLASKTILFQFMCLEDDMRCVSPNLDFLNKWKVGDKVKSVYGSGAVVEVRGWGVVVGLEDWVLANNSKVMCHLGADAVSLK